MASEANLRNTLFGKYETGRLLGKGTFAKVYYGKNLITNESVAIKVILKEKVKKEGLLEQIQREISVMSLVRHPHIVELKEVMATKSKVYFVMEFVNGGELFAKVSQGKLNEDKEQVRIDGLLHTRCGTPTYVAPEVLRKKGYDGAKVDIWSCGVILFVLLAGFLPFRADNVMKLYRKIFNAEYEFPPWFSLEAMDLISKLLVVDPKKRISIPEIMESPWFRNGFSKPIAFNEKDDLDNEISELANPKSSPTPFYNAFEFISMMSSGFDLSSLFENKKKSRSVFTSKCSASTIVTKLVLLAKKLNFKVVNLREYKVQMQANEEGRKGKLMVAVEVFEAAPEVAVVEFSKTAGDTLEYDKFCDKDVRPAIKDIVWSWQGEDHCL